MALIFTNGRLLIDGVLREGLSLAVEGRRISAIGAEPMAGERIDLDGAILAPGFIDSQVNGGGDRLFNDDPSVETIEPIARAHLRFGTTGFLPTLISDELEVVRAGVAAVDAAIEAGVPGVLGIHIEGPFINKERRGIHGADHIRALDEEGFAALTALRHGRTLVTLAPERTTPAFIQRLVAAGVVVAAGHTNGSYADIRAGLDAGISGFTHLFNAMSPLGSREPGAVGAALEDGGAYCALIVDGVHVSPVTMRLAMRCKPIGRFMLVTDAMPTTGGVKQQFSLHGRVIQQRDGQLVSQDGTLAGADLDMTRAVRNAAAMLDVSLAQAMMMASEVPADFLRLGHLGRLAEGADASLIVWDDEGVREAWVTGERMFARA